MKRKQKGEKKLNKIILAAYFMTYNRVHERGRKRITKNIQDNIWRREEWGKYISKREKEKYNIIGKKLKCTSN